MAFLDAQDELNSLAPSERRAEVTAAFVCVIYVLVGSAVVGVGVLGEAVSLTTAVCAAGVVLGAAAACVAAWQRRVAARGWATRPSGART
jgi:protein-S-isoprenylcysteine O-methyltransferase Ste14